MNKNYVQLIGYMTADPKLMTAINGSRRAGLRIATHYKRKTQEDTKIDMTVWHNVVAWGDEAKFAERTFVKGSKILVEGAIDYQKFRCPDGTIKELTFIKAHRLMNLDR